MAIFVKDIRYRLNIDPTPALKNLLGVSRNKTSKDFNIMRMKRGGFDRYNLMFKLTNISRKKKSVVYWKPVVHFTKDPGGGFVLLTSKDNTLKKVKNVLERKSRFHISHGKRNHKRKGDIFALSPF